MDTPAGPAATGQPESNNDSPAVVGGSWEGLVKAMPGPVIVPGTVLPLAPVSPAVESPSAAKIRDAVRRETRVEKRWTGNTSTEVSNTAPTIGTVLSASAATTLKSGLHAVVTSLSGVPVNGAPAYASRRLFANQTGTAALGSAVATPRPVRLSTVNSTAAYSASSPVSKLHHVSASAVVSSGFGIPRTTNVSGKYPGTAASNPSGKFPGTATSPIRSAFVAPSPFAGPIWLNSTSTSVLPEPTLAGIAGQASGMAMASGLLSLGTRPTTTSLAPTTSSSLTKGNVTGSAISNATASGIIGIMRQSSMPMTVPDVASVTEVISTPPVTVTRLEGGTAVVVVIAGPTITMTISASSALSGSPTASLEAATVEVSRTVFLRYVRSPRILIQSPHFSSLTNGNSASMTASVSTVFVGVPVPSVSSTSSNSDSPGRLVGATTPSDEGSPDQLVKPTDSSGTDSPGQPAGPPDSSHGDDEHEEDEEDEEEDDHDDDEDDNDDDDDEKDDEDHHHHRHHHHSSKPSSETSTNPDSSAAAVVPPPHSQAQTIQVVKSTDMSEHTHNALQKILPAAFLGAAGAGALGLGVVGLFKHFTKTGQTGLISKAVGASQGGKPNLGKMDMLGDFWSWFDIRQKNGGSPLPPGSAPLGPEIPVPPGLNGYRPPPPPAPVPPGLNGPMPPAPPNTPSPGTPVEPVAWPPFRPVPDWPGFPVPGSPVPDSPLPEMPVPGLPVPGLPVPDRPLPGTPVPGSPVPGSPVPGSPVPGSPVPGSPVPGSPVPGSPVPGSPVPGSPVPGLPLPGSPVPGSPLPIEPGLPVPVEPGLPLPVEPNLPLPIEPGTPTPVDPVSPVPVQPGSPAPVNPDLPMPVEPGSSIPVEPGVPVPVDPLSPVPVEPGSPVPVEPVSPVPGSPVSPVPVDPVSPVPGSPILPVPVDPVSPVPGSPVSPVSADPASPVPVEQGGPWPGLFKAPERKMILDVPRRGEILIDPGQKLTAIPGTVIRMTETGRLMTHARGTLVVCSGPCGSNPAGDRVLALEKKYSIELAVEGIEEFKEVYFPGPWDVTVSWYGPGEGYTARLPEGVTFAMKQTPFDSWATDISVDHNVYKEPQTTGYDAYNPPPEPNRWDPDWHMDPESEMTYDINLEFLRKQLKKWHREGRYDAVHGATISEVWEGLNNFEVLKDDYASGKHDADPPPATLWNPPETNPIRMDPPTPPEIIWEPPTAPEVPRVQYTPPVYPKKIPPRPKKPATKPPGQRGTEPAKKRTATSPALHRRVGTNDTTIVLEPWKATTNRPVPPALPRKPITTVADFAAAFWEFYPLWQAKKAAAAAEAAAQADAVAKIEAGAKAEAKAKAAKAEQEKKAKQESEWKQAQEQAEDSRTHGCRAEWDEHHQSRKVVNRTTPVSLIMEVFGRNTPVPRGTYFYCRS